MQKRLAGISVPIAELVERVDAGAIKGCMAFPRTAKFQYCYIDHEMQRIVFVYEHPKFPDRGALFLWPSSTETLPDNE